MNKLIGCVLIITGIAILFINLLPGILIGIFGCIVADPAWDM